MENSTKKTFFKKITAYLFLISICIFYFNCRDNQLQKLNQTIQQTKEDIYLTTTSILDDIYINTLEDFNLTNKLHNSFPTEKIDFLKKINNSLKESNIYAKYQINSIIDFKKYKIEKTNGYYSIFQFQLETYLEDGSLISKENKIIEVYILNDNGTYLITDLFIKNKG